MISAEDARSLQNHIQMNSNMCTYSLETILDIIYNYVIDENNIKPYIKVYGILSQELQDALTKLGYTFSTDVKNITKISWKKK